VSSYSRDRIERVVMWPSMNPVVETNIAAVAAVKGSKGSSEFLSTLREYCSFVIVIVVITI